MTSSPYSGLDSSTKEIRLVKILPSEDEESPLRIALQKASLNDVLEFEALSYAWGEITVTVDIKVDDCTMALTENLHGFLRALRKPQEERIVWADYICINQADPSEQTSQLQLMAQIYATASSVIAWMGELTPPMEETIAFMQLDDESSAKELEEFERVRGREVVLKKPVEGLLILSAIPYWYRLWTFQEWHLAKQTPVCMAGKITFTLNNWFHWLYTTISEAKNRSLAEAFTQSVPEESIPGEKTELNEKEDQDMRQWDALLADPEMDRLLKNIPRDVMQQSRLCLDSNDHSTLRNLLSLTFDRKCSRELDRVYAVYGLCPQASAAYPPDYEKSNSQVNLETTVFILRHELDMKVFCDFDFCFNSDKNDKSLPSWALDFITTDPERRAHIQQSSYKNMSLDKGLWEQIGNHTPAITDDCRTLKVWGRSLGVTPHIWDLPSNPVHCFGYVQTISECFKDRAGINDDIFHISEGVKNAAYYYTGCSDHIPYDQYHKFMEKCILTNTDDFSKAIDGYFATICQFFTKLENKKLFHIDNYVGGHWTTMNVGFTDCEMQMGDTIMIPCGVAQPFILRPVLEQTFIDGNEDWRPVFELSPNGEKELCLRVVGRAFVEGISDRQDFAENVPMRMLEMTEFKQWYIR